MNNISLEDRAVKLSTSLNFKISAGKSGGSVILGPSASINNENILAHLFTVLQKMTVFLQEILYSINSPAISEHKSSTLAPVFTMYFMLVRFGCKPTTLKHFLKDNLSSIDMSMSL